jgi:hypothetical protein
MPLQCPQCQSSILAQQINQQLQATCPQYNTIFSVADQLEDLLAYQHPKKIDPTPANIDETYTNGTLVITLGRFEKSWQQYLALWVVILLPALLLVGGIFVVPKASPSLITGLGVFIVILWLFTLFLMISEYLRKIIVIVTQSYLVIGNIVSSGMELKKQLATRDIKQLYLKKSLQAFPILNETRVYYELWALCQKGQAELLIKDLKDWPTALYLEQHLEATLHLKDQSVEGELDYLSPDEQRQLLEWRTLAEHLGLTFIPGSGGGCYQGYYPKLDLTSVSQLHECGDYEAHDDQGRLFQLDAFYQCYKAKFIKYTRLRLIKANLAPTPLSPEEVAELENLLEIHEPVGLLMPPVILKDLKGILDIRPEEGVIYYEQTGIETDLTYLEKLFELLSYIAIIYPKILAWGGAAVPALRAVATQVPSLKGVARQLLQDIATETQTRLEKQAKYLLCSSCLQNCTTHKIWLPSAEPLLYYGCRACRQSREFLVVKGSIVAVLDGQMSQPYDQQGESLYVNWLQYRQPFDFNEVHIRQATDQDVERFAIQVGNDTDMIRQPRYTTMRCVVWSDAGLSENSLKILKRTFGRVEIKTQDRQELQEKVKTSEPRLSRLGSEAERGMAEDAQQI